MGSFGISLESATGPPVELPMATIAGVGKPARRGARGGACSGAIAEERAWRGSDAAAGFAGEACKVDKTARSWALSCSRLVARSPPIGLVMKSQAPSSSARIVSAAPCRVSALTITTRSPGMRAIKPGSVSSPLIPGISMSSVTRSGLNSSSLAKASLPSTAWATQRASPEALIPAASSER